MLSISYCEYVGVRWFIVFSSPVVWWYLWYLSCSICPALSQYPSNILNKCFALYLYNVLSHLTICDCTLPYLLSKIVSKHCASDVHKMSVTISLTNDGTLFQICTLWFQWLVTPRWTCIFHFVLRWYFNNSLINIDWYVHKVFLAAVGKQWYPYDRTTR